MTIEARIRALQEMTRKVASGTQGLRIRLAARWLRAGLERDMDILMRLQVLEGAAGVPVDTWMKKQRAGLPMAQAFFEGQPVAPEWFNPGDSGLFSIVRSSVQSIISKLKLRRVEPLDIISGYLMGLGVNISGPEVKRPCYAVGQKDAEGILAGRETPQRIAKGRLSRYFVNKVWPEERKQKDVGIPVDNDGNQMDIADPSFNQDLAPGMVDYAHDAFGEFLAETVFRNLRDPIGVRIRDLMRASWHDSPPMLLWLDILEQEHRYPKQKEVAEKAGINPAAFHARHWKPRWKKFFMDLRSKSTLLRALEDSAAREGIQWSSDSLMEANPDTILSPRSDRPRPRAASFLQALTIKIAHRFILQQDWHS